ncbi:TPA: TIGR04028 family ABC transporter substrate-binding protein [Klebsiella aerogenes]|uniref:Nickel ABC transporter periplasmic substrate-binding protein n=1 Tax=Klebsiella aerogenes (strain ATCC 13048 / DSM 30053 / CCUG 1429 / JCM 1235 / KCTC 2190 / NBRC 13534 / NCIMB 10102 / NCTC 10006 / CDC 819-56) TaxID=1028307 RepID=A0A0H3FT23_KLEAK|nr:TIGR04028 family ABC transporter substrate-binding protein [Klebsiella aerogenes]AEG98860.1 nickel ABC transporter periplasmic substrate-binding protein [Klebsiella aerogenes KCTC 2190]KLF33351.1 ABC transporter substrate-binding protein [Klebsiella aerogenes]MEC4757277.1 TIGR04028 family ABC transporter substrate-binding protein [Klebsiella aerogenes]QEU18339.1 TIGR04028 family ABC transporter substrate-binding protein [Klebsiella aerogenes]QXB12446.1 TIGR04028 family ABC transporter subst
MQNRFRLPTLAALFIAGAFSVSAAQTPIKGGTLIYLEQQPHTNLYPPAGGFYPNGGILNQITDKLTWQNPETLAIEPWIAESWSSNDEKTEYTFKLRPGVTFSDGTPLDANAVAKNFDTYGLGNKALRLPVSEVINNYDRSEVIDPLTVKFYFKKPSPGFLQGTATIGSGLVSLSTLARSFEALGDARHIIGSGPFTVKDEKPGRELTLVARKDYQWGPKNLAQQGPANLDGITYIVTPEDSVRIGALLAGQAGFIRQVQAYDEKQATDQGFNIYAAPTRGVNDSLSFRPDNPLVADQRVRQALLHATNAKQVVETLFSPNYPQASSVIARTAAGYVDLSDKLAFDQQKAKQLLDEAGWTPGADGIRQKAGQRLALTVYESLPQPQNKEVLQLVAQQWRQVGVALSVKAGDAGSRVLDNLDPLKTPLTVSEVGRADPDVVKSMFFPANRDALLQQGGSSDKVKSFRDDKLNALLTAISAEVDGQKRLQLTGDAQRYLLDNAYVIPIFEEPQVFAGASWVKGVRFEAVGRPSFYGVWLDKH